MFKYLLYFLFVTELTGVILMENGAYSASCGSFGYKNGASFAFCGYIALALIAFFFAIKTKLFSFPLKYRNINSANFQGLAIVIFIINLFFLIVILVGYGGIDVLTLKIGKGEFRSTMGFLGSIGFGSVGYMIIKGFAPALLAYLSFVYIKSKETLKNKFLLFINFAIIFFIGAMCGSKAASIFMLLPALIIIYWKVSLKKLFALGMLFLIVLVAFAAIYDEKPIDFRNLELSSFLAPSQNAISWVIYRATVLQGDVSWKIWDMYVNNEELFSYASTLLSAGGNKLLGLLGISSEDNFEEFAKYQYSTMLTHVVGYPLDELQSGRTNVTGTIFSEGVIAGGLAGVFIFSIIAGLLAGLNYKVIKYALKNNNAIVASLASTYFCFGIFSWLNSGGITGLFHIAIIIQLILGFVFIKLAILIARDLQKISKN